VKFPSFPFYPGDWQNDLNLQSCSMAAQGLLINLMCLMHQSDEYGVLLISGRVPDQKQVAKLTRLSPKKFTFWFSELVRNEVLKIRSDGAIVCQRMVKDHALRQTRARCGARGGNPVLVNQKDKLEPKQKSPSSSSSSSSGKSKEEDSLRSSSCPEVRQADSGQEPSCALDLIPPGSIAVIPEPACFIPLVDGSEHPVSFAQAEEWGQAYPAVDVLQELRKARAWCDANPKNRKTAKGVKRFLNQWLSKAQDRAPRQGQGQPQGIVPRTWKEARDFEQRTEAQRLRQMKEDLDAQRQIGPDALGQNQHAADAGGKVLDIARR
jgi:hypothetical protein